MNGKQFATCNQTIVDALGYGGTCSNDCSYANIEIEPGKTYLFRIVQPTYLSTCANIRLGRRSTVSLAGVLQDTNCKSSKSMVAAGSSLMKPITSSFTPVHSPFDSPTNRQDNDMQLSLRAKVKLNWQHMERTIITFRWKTSKTRLLQQVDHHPEEGTKRKPATVLHPPEQKHLPHQVFWPERLPNLNLLGHKERPTRTQQPTQPRLVQANLDPTTLLPLNKRHRRPQILILKPTNLQTYKPRLLHQVQEQTTVFRDHHSAI